MIDKYSFKFLIISDSVTTTCEVQKGQKRPFVGIIVSKKRNLAQFLANHLKKGCDEDAHVYGFVNIDMTECLAQLLIEEYARDAPYLISHEDLTTTPMDGAVYVFNLNVCVHFPKTDNFNWNNHTRSAVNKNTTTSRSVIKRSYVWKNTNGLPKTDSTRKKYAYYFPQEKLYVIHYLGSGYKQVNEEIKVVHVQKEKEEVIMSAKEVHASLDDMKDFPSFINRLQNKYSHLGGIKVIPPCDWTGRQTFEQWSAQLRGTKVQPKTQHAEEVQGAEGVFRLTYKPEKEQTVNVRTAAIN